MPKKPYAFDEPESEHDTVQAREKRGPGRGFYGVLALCLIAVSGVAAATFSDKLKEPAETLPSTTATTVRTTSAAPVAVTRAPTVTSAATTTVTTTVATTAPSALFALPMSNVVLTPFSEQPRYNPTLDTYEAHTAVDFDGEEEQAVHALAQGNISHIEDHALWGDSVTVDHGDGITSVYRGVRCSLPLGTLVEAGQEIGKLSAVPCEADLGPHLHLELYQSGKPADPCPLLGDELIRNN